MPADKLERDRRVSERQAPWLVLAGLGSLATAALALAVDGGALSEFEGFSSVLRGYTLVGLLLGVSSAICCLFTFAYSLRKRPLQEHWPIGKSTLAAWLWAHVYFGVLAITLALAHAGYGAVSLELSTGKLLLLVLILIAGSGAIWRAVYAVLPKRAARRVGNYSFQASRDRARECKVEIDKISAGRSPAFQQATAWLLSASATEADLARAQASLPVDEHGVFREVARLAAERHAALAREGEQKRYLVSLSRSRLLHVPLGVAFLALLPLHIVGALEIPAHVAPLEALEGVSAGAFEPSHACKDCHQSIYDEWRQSMHAHGMTSPLMIAQTNLVVRQVLSQTSSPDPREVCVNCHGPVGALMTREATLPLSGGELGDEELLNDGVSCVVCHQWDGESHSGQGGLIAFQDSLDRGRTYYGPYDDAVGNAFHKSETNDVFRKPDRLCQNCHVVQLDKNGDGKFERGVDLVLQTLYDEWQATTESGGPTCLDCHMPVTSRRRSADGASVPFEQDREAPDRVTRDHGFVAVDYPLDDGAVRAETRPKREALLRSAATLGIVPNSLKQADGKLEFAVEVRNTGTGHNLPGGFAFVRQMWLEVTLFDAGGREVATSGKLARASDDLCDASIVDDPKSPVLPFLQGCTKADAQLVNFQQMLVDEVEIARDASGAILKGPRGENLLARAPGSEEAIIQHLTGGPVPRRRAATGELVAPLPFGSAATFTYGFAPGAQVQRVAVRLLFRAVPPYFMRALDKAQPDVGLARYIDAIEVNEATRTEARLSP